MKVLIVDDEPLAQDILETYAQKVPGMEVCGKCKNALEAFSFLSRQTVDLMLLDINMPEINGMDFLKTLKNPPKIIFTTAYSEYALESYELNAVDYLMKPISFERFLRSIDKVSRLFQTAQAETSGAVQSLPQQAANENNLIFVKSEGKLIKIDLSQAWFIEGLKDYVRFWTDGGKIIVHSTMKNVEEQLDHLPHFVRVHKSYIVNIKYVSEVWGNSLKIKNELITIGNTYRDDVHKLFDGYKLL